MVWFILPCPPAPKLLCYSLSDKKIMTLDEARRQIKECAASMDAAYQQTVFDEWAIVSFRERKGIVLNYLGPRREDFQKNLASDLQDLRVQLLSNTHGVGDFEFARHGVGTKAEAFMVVGQGIYLICNHTASSMDNIARDPLWLQAQVPFVELSEKFRADPLVPAS
jgi:hypothetical protein